MSARRWRVLTDLCFACAIVLMALALRDERIARDKLDRIQFKFNEAVVRGFELRPIP